MDVDVKNKNAIAASTDKWSTLKDGTLKLTVLVEPFDAREAIELLGTEPGIPVAIARLGGGSEG